MPALGAGADLLARNALGVEEDGLLLESLLNLAAKQGQRYALSNKTPYSPVRPWLGLEDTMNRRLDARSSVVWVLSKRLASHPS